MQRTSVTKYIFHPPNRSMSPDQTTTAITTIPSTIHLMFIISKLVILSLLRSWCRYNTAVVQLILGDQLLLLYQTCISSEEVLTEALVLGLS